MLFLRASVWILRIPGSLQAPGLLRAPLAPVRCSW